MGTLFEDCKRCSRICKYSSPLGRWSCCFCVHTKCLDIMHMRVCDMHKHVLVVFWPCLYWANLILSERALWLSCFGPGHDTSVWKLFVPCLFFVALRDGIFKELFA